MQTIAYTLGSSLYFNLTNRCPNKCVFCVRNSVGGIGSAESLFLEREPSLDESVSELGKRDPNNYDELVFCGYGEPACALDVMLGTAKRAKEMGFNTRLNTNGLGSLINGKDVPPLLKGVIDAVSISLNASGAKRYQEICRSDFGEDAFCALLKFAVQCKDYVPKVRLTVVDVIGADEIQECSKLAKEIGVDLAVRRTIMHDEPI
jgi:TatD family-associated radical SAM protein